MKAWRLVIWNDEILAWPYGLAEGFLLGLWLELGIGHDPGDFSSKTPEQLQAALATPATQRFAVAELQQITVQCSSLRHKVELTARDGNKTRFGILHRHDLANYQRELRRAFPALYHEAGFPTTLWERIVKY
ncbi:MAG: hypothetical protein U0Q16_30940 [Bryobacteraceae bacterium]